MELYNQAIERDIIAYLQDQTAPVSLAELEKALALGRDEKKYHIVPRLFF